MEVKTKVCSHCRGTGQCWCEECSLQHQECGDEPDTGRQGEGQCRQCNGLGKVNLDGTPLREEGEWPTPCIQAMTGPLTKLKTQEGGDGFAGR